MHDVALDHAPAGAGRDGPRLDPAAPVGAEVEVAPLAGGPGREQAPAAVGLTPAGLLSVQRLAGNRAAAALVRGGRHAGGPGAGPLQRAVPRSAPSRPPGRVEHHGRTTTAVRPLPAGAAPAVQRLDLGIPDLGDILGQIPGYDMLTVVVGFDPATGAPVEPTPSNLVRAVMGLVPGGRFVHDRLVELGVLQDVSQLIEAQLAAHDLTAARLQRDVDRAWDEVDLTPRLGIIDEAVAVAERHLGNLLRDVERLATSLVERVLAVIKEAAIGQAERLLAESESARRVWDLARAVLHHDPLRGEPVEATTEQIIERFLLLIGKEAELEQMRAQGTLAATAEWLDTQLAQFSGIVDEFGALVDAALDALTFEGLPELPAKLADLAQRGLALVERIAAFAATVAEKVLQLIKDALLGLLSEHANAIPGFHLLTVLLGRNPFTGEEVPRTAENLIRGFFTLIPGGEAQYEQLAETGVIPRAAARIDAAVASLGISWEFVVGLFTELWGSFSALDLADPVAAFDRVVARFQEPISRLVSFVGTVVQEVFTLVLQVMGFPSDLVGRIIDNALAAFDRIAQDPVGFFLNLLGALKLGLGRFFDNIVGHLADGLAAWLLRGLEGAGVRLPQELTLESVLDLVLQVLGITVENLWAKLAQRIGPERVEQLRGAVDRLSGIWEFVKDVQERGIAAIWDHIAERVGNLWDLLLQKAQDWIMTEIVEAVVAKLLSMLDPTGIMAVVNSFLAFFRAVQSAIEYLREILEIVDRYVATIADIAAGTLEPAAAQMEGGLAAAIPVAIGFLANQVGLGDIAGKIREIIGSLRELVEGALDWLLDRAMEAGSAILGAIRGGDDSEEGRDERERLGEQDAARFVNRWAGRPVGRAVLAPTLGIIRTRRGLDSLELVALGSRWAVEARVDRTTPTQAEVGAGGAEASDAVGHARAGGAAGGPLLVGARGPYGQIKDGQDPRRGEHPTLALIAEHVIPREAISVLSEALGGPGVPSGGGFYDQMVTIKIYADAAVAKTRSDPDDTSLRPTVDGHVASAAGAGPGFVARRQRLADLLLAEVDELRRERSQVTATEVQAENAGPAGAARGTSDDTRPSASDIEDVAQGQAHQVKQFLRDALELGLAARDERGRPDLGGDEPQQLNGFSISEEIARRYGGSEPDTHAGYLTRIPLGAEGGRGARGVATLRFEGDSWTISLGRSGTLKPEARGMSVSGPTDGTAAARIGGFIEAVRRGDHDAEEAGETGYSDEYRQLAVAKYQQELAGGATPHGAAVRAIEELAPSPTTGRKPVPATVRRWAGG